jgi:hypothetical protein
VPDGRVTRARHFFDLVDRKLCLVRKRDPQHGRASWAVVTRQS